MLKILDFVYLCSQRKQIVVINSMIILSYYLIIIVLCFIAGRINGEPGLSERISFLGVLVDLREATSHCA